MFDGHLPPSCREPSNTLRLPQGHLPSSCMEPSNTLRLPHGHRITSLLRYFNFCDLDFAKASLRRSYSWPDRPVALKSRTCVFDATTVRSDEVCSVLLVSVSHTQTKVHFRNKIIQQSAGSMGSSFTCIKKTGENQSRIR